MRPFPKVGRIILFPWDHPHRKPLLVEISLLFEKDSVLLIERDSGVIFDVTDPELKIDGLSSFVINGLLNAQKEKAYLTTTGYNRNMIRFCKT